MAIAASGGGGWLPMGQSFPESTEDTIAGAGDGDTIEGGDNNNDGNLGIWDKPKSEGGEKQQDTIAGPSQDELSQQFNQFYDGLQIAPEISQEDAQAIFQEQSPEALAKVLDKHGRKMYQKLIDNMQTIAKNYASEAEKNAVFRAGNVDDAKGAINDMHRALPFTNDPDLGPAAKSVLAAAMGQGKDTGQAIESVKQFFAKAGKLSAKDTNPKGGQNQPGFRVPSDDDDAGEDDMLALLSG